MRSNKRYTNTTISKRVDHESARAVRQAAEPLLCERCGAVYIHRRWTKPESLRKNEKHVRWHPNQKVTCPACKQQLEGEPAGFVYIAGEFLYSHREEIERLIENEAARAGQNNPLARIMKIERKESDGITVTTTT